MEVSEASIYLSLLEERLGFTSLKALEARKNGILGPVPENSDFSLQNLPYGIFSTPGSAPHIGVAIGDSVLDLKFLAQDGAFTALNFDVTTLEQPTLNAFAALGRKVHREVRKWLQGILDKDTKFGQVLRDNHERRDYALISQTSVTMHLPMAIGDYTDFFVGYSHAVNCAITMKGQPIEAVCPCFYNLPVAYHGRASSVVVSGTPFRRPKGQFPVDGKVLSAPCRKLDYEVEFACFISHGNEYGSSIDVDNAEEYIFGFVLMNDWSARDIQMYEASMMGPFQGKNFCTTVSPWIVPFDALEPFRTAPKAPRQLAKYLTESKKESAYDLPVVAKLKSKLKRTFFANRNSKTDIGCAAELDEYRIATCNTNNVIFSFAQMIAHHTRDGCPLRTGDLIATGTISGENPDEIGCFLESTKNGAIPYDLQAEAGFKGTIRRTFLEDGDIVEYSAQVRTKSGFGVGFGVCQGQVFPATE